MYIEVYGILQSKMFVLFEMKLRQKKKKKTQAKYVFDA